MVKRKYYTKTKGIGGKFKRRYADFIVEEVGKDGRVCRVERFVKDKGCEEGEAAERGEAWEEKKLIIPKKPAKKDYLHIDLEKINKDLELSCKKLARFLRVSRKRVEYAGIKDKRGITCQRISIWKPDVERLGVFNSRGVDLRNPKWSAEKIDIGNLLANRFTITIRDIDLKEEEIEKRVKECFVEMKKGIPNYFGEQRFGGIRKISHLVGKEMIKGNFKEAVMMYLTAPSEKEEEDIKLARSNLAESGDFKEALKEFPTKYKYERAMLNYLSKYPRDFVGSLQTIPRKLRYLFTHAYQSYLFNKLIDKRIKVDIGLGACKGEKTEGKIPLGLLPGYESELDKGKVGELEKELLEEEGIKLEEFKLKTLAECSTRGSRKEIVLFPKKLKLLKIERDEFFPGKNCCKISFELSKGNYATTVLEELMKNSN